MIHIAPEVDDGIGENEGPKEAFCPLLFDAGQGALMVITDDDGTYVETKWVRGLCTKAKDCDECEYMQHEVANHPPDEVSWVCPTCLEVVYDWARKTGVPIGVPGFYSRGYCDYPWCSRPGGDAIKMPAKYSFFRQVVFGRIRT
jgi:hypothetical protein